MVKQIKEEGGEQVCSVCIERAALARIDSCIHRFCFKCISKWSKKKNTCPICRTHINTIFHKNKTVNLKKNEIPPTPNIPTSIQRRPPTVYFPLYFMPFQPTFNYPQISTLQYYPPTNIHPFYQLQAMNFYGR